MGSLMAGWDSPIQDPKYVALQRNRSFTKEEIEAYRRSKKKAEEELLAAASSPADGTQDQYMSGDAGSECERMNFREMKTDAWEKLIKDNGWWTRSKWAFLNEPPLSGGPTNSYASQFHVANLHLSKPNDGAGSSP